MYPTPRSDVRQRVALLFSQRSRDLYAAEAVERGETYTFSDAWGQPKTWLKGEYAYLSPNAASAVLNRCNIKHDWVEEEELDDEALPEYWAVLVPNAGHLRAATIRRLEAWLRQTEGRLIVTGRTNLPPELLGLIKRDDLPVSGYTGWRWLPGSPFGDRQAWEDCYITGYRGHTAARVEPALGSKVLAEMVELTGDLSSTASVTQRPLGPAIVVGERTVYVANQMLELLGGAMQGHLNVEAIRGWSNPTHWGDRLAYFLRGLLLEVGLEPLWETRLRSFGAYDGAFSFRQDVHGQQQFAFLDYETQNLVPASFDLEEPTVAEYTTPEQAREWARRTSGYSFIEQGLHNDAVTGDPPWAVRGPGLHEHIKTAEESLGYPIYTCGRHGGGHLHPETLDAMDYLYAHNDRILGLCTFSFYHMIEYGVRNPDVVVKGRNVTYATNPVPTIATPGFWFPYHAAVTTDNDWRLLRGWDRTHDYDCGYDLVDTIFGGHTARASGVVDQLENPVYSLQYHPEHARNPAQNDGMGTLPYLQYALSLAERLNLWIANERQLYERMSDYQDLAFRVEDDGSVVVHNPTSRVIEGLALERTLPFGSVWDGADELVHVVGGRTVTLPPLAPGQRKTIRFEAHRTGSTMVVQPGHKGLIVLDARHCQETEETRLRVKVCREQQLRVEGVKPEGSYQVRVDAGPARIAKPETVRSTASKLSAQPREGVSTANAASSSLVFLRVSVSGEQNRFVERTISITPLP
ncbi:MAG: hypothetical protein ACYC4L_08580 [Chloroflexota bacterium]